MKSKRFLMCIPDIPAPGHNADRRAYTDCIPERITLAPPVRIDPPLIWRRPEPCAIRDGTVIRRTPRASGLSQDT